MAENEVYRVEIPVIVDDQSEAPLSRASERVSRFEKEARKQNERIRKHFEQIAKMQIEPVMRIRDQLTSSVLRADKLLKRLSLEQASPVIAAQDRISSVVTRINAILDALDKGKVDVFAELKGPLMDEIVKAKASLKVLEGVRAGPVADLRGELFGQLTKAMSQLKSLDKIEATPKATLRERVLSRAKEIGSVLWNLTSRAWKVVLQVKDNVTGTVKNIADKIKNLAGKLTSPLGLLGAGAGAGAGIIFPLKLAGEMEQAGIAMEFFTGSVEKGQKFLERLQVFAAKTPFEFPDVREAAVGLLPLYKNMYGVDKAMNETIRTLRAFGDAAGLTGAGIQGMNLALLGFRQIGTMGKLGMEELRQVTENLLIPMDIILKELGLTGDALDDLGKRGIPAKKAMEAIVRALEKNFAGGMEKMSTILPGLVSTLKDTARLTVTAFGTGMAEPVKRILLDIIGLTDNTSGKFEAFQKRLEEAGRQVGESFERIYGRLKDFWGKLSADPKFQQLSFGDKIIYVINLALDQVSKWLDSEGGLKLQDTFAKIGEISAKAWIAGLEGAFKGVISSAANGNILGAGAMLGLASILGGGLLLRGGIGLGKSIFAAGKWTYGKLKSLSTVGAAEVAAAEATAAAGANASKALPILGRIKPWLGRFGIPIATGFEAINIARAEDKRKAIFTGTGRIAGMIVGSKAGTVVGSAIGGLFGGLGAAPGAVIGSLIGGLGGFFGGEVLAEKINALLDKVDFNALKEKAISWIKELPGEVAEYLGYIVGYAVEKLSQLPGAFSEWFRNAKDNAIQWVIGLPDQIAGFVASIPSKVSAAIESVKEIFSKLGRAIPEAIVSGFNWAKDRLGAAGQWIIDKAIAGVETVKNLGKRFVEGYEAGRKAAQVAKYARGGIITRPHLGLIGEAGPEVIIPLAVQMRSRALALWEETGRRLGVRPYAEGGFAGPIPVLATSRSSASVASINLNFDLTGLVGQIVVNNQSDIEDAIDKITDAIAENLHKVFTNMTTKK